VSPTLEAPERGEAFARKGGWRSRRSHKGGGGGVGGGGGGDEEVENWGFLLMLYQKSGTAMHCEGNGQKTQEFRGGSSGG